MPQNQKQRPEIQKRPLGSRQGLARAQRLNAELKAKKVAAASQVRGPLMSDVRSGAGAPAGANAIASVAGAGTTAAATGASTLAVAAGANARRPVDTPRPVARTEFEQRVLAQRRERARTGSRLGHSGVDTSVLRPQTTRVRATQTRLVAEMQTVQTTVATGSAAGTVARSVAGATAGSAAGAVAGSVAGAVAHAAAGHSAALRKPASAHAPATRASATSVSSSRATSPLSRRRRSRQPNLKRPQMTPEIEQRPLGQPRYEHLPAGATVGDALGATYQDFDPSEPELPTEAEFIEAVEPPAEVKPVKKSPFLESVKVEKRPLSRRLYHDENIPNEVFADFPEDDPELEPPATEPEPRKRSVLPLLGLLALTVVLGAIVGAVVYLCIFQQF